MNTPRFHPSQYEFIEAPDYTPQVEPSTETNVTVHSNTRSMFKALYGETLLTLLFFSDENIANIQKLIRMLVFKHTEQVIDNQSETELLIVMRSVFLEYSAHPELIDESMPQKQKKLLYKKYTREVARLNEIVVNMTVPDVVSQVRQYFDYLRDASQQPYQIATPQNDSVAGARQYRSVTQVLLGGNL